MGEHRHTERRLYVIGNGQLERSIAEQEYSVQFEIQCTQDSCWNVSAEGKSRQHMLEILWLLLVSAYVLSSMLVVVISVYLLFYSAIELILSGRRNGCEITLYRSVQLQR